MHFAFPPRKTSNPPPYAARKSRSSSLRNTRLRTIAVIAVGAIGILYLIIRLFSGSRRTYIPPGTPKAVVVTVMEPGLSESYKEVLKDNRRDYASRHGMADCTAIPGRPIADSGTIQAMRLSFQTTPTIPSPTAPRAGQSSPRSDTQ